MSALSSLPIDLRQQVYEFRLKQNYLIENEEKTAIPTIIINEYIDNSEPSAFSEEKAIRYTRHRSGAVSIVNAISISLEDDGIVDTDEFGNIIASVLGNEHDTSDTN